ncbi:bacteriocin ABC transporter ATP-binding protein/permease [Yersinia rohdei]|uniref:Bacteriocin ABC transporter ATP-binding protein/permease n=1 Tax=Yersinia rohdei TaxID=29485 RepID=A0A0U1HQ92_YERRO|nr:bacteriocin ABC transporter ATP-binding protein/permease [Yersinia rohdei]
MMNIYETGLLLKIKSIIKVILIISSKVLSRICLANTTVSFSTRNLTYQYNNLSATVINKFNLDIKSGESIAIVGPSGVGKTTLMKLMSGLLKPSAGSLLVNGLDIHTIGINNYRQCIACVLQDDKLFAGSIAGSIAENIASFESSLDIEWVMGCARHCNIHDDIMKLPMAYERYWVNWVAVYPEAKNSAY